MERRGARDVSAKMTPGPASPLKQVEPSEALGQFVVIRTFKQVLGQPTKLFGKSEEVFPKSWRLGGERIVQLVGGSVENHAVDVHAPVFHRERVPRDLQNRGSLGKLQRFGLFG